MSSLISQEFKIRYSKVVVAFEQENDVPAVAAQDNQESRDNTNQVKYVG